MTEIYRGSSKLFMRVGKSCIEPEQSFMTLIRTLSVIKHLSKITMLGAFQSWMINDRLFWLW